MWKEILTQQFFFSVTPYSVRGKCWARSHRQDLPLSHLQCESEVDSCLLWASLFSVVKWDKNTYAASRGCYKDPRKQKMHLGNCKKPLKKCKAPFLYNKYRSRGCHRRDSRRSPKEHRLTPPPFCCSLDQFLATAQFLKTSLPCLKPFNKFFLSLGWGRDLVTVTMALM